MEALLVLAAIFFLVVCPIWVLALLSDMRRSLERMADDVRLLHMASCRSADGSSAPATIPPPLPVAPRATLQPLDEPRTPLDDRIAAAAAHKAVSETPKSRKPDIAKPELPTLPKPDIPPPVPLSIQPETPVVAPTPSEPTKIERWAEAAWEWLRVGETWRPGWIPGQFAVAAVQLMRAAALLLLFGAAWTVRYIHERGWLPPGWRIA
ncbi:MAG: hypothetical protein IKO40_06410, partial [Kiritimatiellae bacterium]|nr:hypothetical protein [Kiritimatiellia bacterium]